MATAPEATFLNGRLSRCLPTFSPEFATLFANAVTFLQEWMAVTFQLVCLSRLETTAGIESLLILFLTLVVFTGPYLNGWLLYMDYICFQSWHPSYLILEHILVGIAITVAHVLGSLTAWAIVKDWQPIAKSTISWNVTAPTKANNNDLYVHFFEEMLGVLSLLIGCAYLLWLKNIRRDKPVQAYEKMTPKIDIKFYMQLTLLVAAVSQAFPSAYLSPHILCYKVFTQLITPAVCLTRLGAGAVALIVTCVWLLVRVSYRQAIQYNLDKEHEHHIPLLDHKDLPTNVSQRMPAIRLSMHGGTYF